MGNIRKSAKQFSSEEQRLEHIREVNRIRSARKRARDNQDKEKREQVLRKMREYHHRKCANETREQREKRLIKCRQNLAKYYAKESEEQRQERAKRYQEYDKKRYQKLSEEQKQARKERERLRLARQSEEKRLQRLERTREARKKRRLAAGIDSGNTNGNTSSCSSFASTTSMVSSDVEFGPLIGCSTIGTSSNNNNNVTNDHHLLNLDASGLDSNLEANHLTNHIDVQIEQFGDEDNNNLLDGVSDFSCFVNSINQNEEEGGNPNTVNLHQSTSLQQLQPLPSIASSIDLLHRRQNQQQHQHSHHHHHQHQHHLVDNQLLPLSPQLPLTPMITAADDNATSSHDHQLHHHHSHPDQHHLVDKHHPVTTSITDSFLSDQCGLMIYPFMIQDDVNNSDSIVMEVIREDREHPIDVNVDEVDVGGHLVDPLHHQQLPLPLPGIGPSSSVSSAPSTSSIVDCHNPNCIATIQKLQGEIERLMKLYDDCQHQHPQYQHQHHQHHHQQQQYQHYQI